MPISEIALIKLQVLLINTLLLIHEMLDVLFGRELVHLLERG
jgi:hypothetical protein